MSEERDAVATNVDGLETVDVDFGEDHEDVILHWLRYWRASAPAMMKIYIEVSVPSGGRVYLFFPRSGGN